MLPDARAVDLDLDRRIALIDDDDRALHFSLPRLLLIAEISCEDRNLFLDNLLAETMAAHQAAFYTSR